MSTLTREKFIEYVNGDKNHDSTVETQYYLKLFDSHYTANQAENHWFMEWNWYAFFLGPIWLAYRGMFWVAVGCILTYKLLEFMNPAFQILGISSLWILIGLYGNAVYLQHVAYFIKTHNADKKGVDVTMGALVCILFLIELASLFAG